MIRSEEETLPRKKLENLQLERLRDLAARVYDKVPFYKEAFDKAGVSWRCASKREPGSFPKEA